MSVHGREIVLKGNAKWLVITLKTTELFSKLLNFLPYFERNKTYQSESAPSKFLPCFWNVLFLQPGISSVVLSSFLFRVLPWSIVTK